MSYLKSNFYARLSFLYVHAQKQQALVFGIAIYGGISGYGLSYIFMQARHAFFQNLFIFIQEPNTKLQLWYFHNSLKQRKSIST